MNARTILELNINKILDEIDYKTAGESGLGIAIASDEVSPVFALRNVGENSSEMISTLNLTLAGQRVVSKYQTEKFKFEFDGTVATIVLAYEHQTKNQSFAKIIVDIVLKESFNEKGTFVKIVPLS